MTMPLPALPEGDETHWPLAILVAEKLLDADGIRAGLDTVERWLKREQPFALLLIAGCEFVAPSDAATLPIIMQRIGLAREALCRSLLGIAVVAPASAVDAARRSLARLPLDMPLEVFEKGSLAVRWLCASALSPAGLVIDSL
ncbi:MULTISPECIES: hypothetical protein [unclassified Rhizobium]|jgi:hypothetical protein|uniref:hypothetical protein n=1 Tax=unclassified Rhizobium TaxID=2613769 RepID=UPI0006473535|nr:MULTISPECIES: hypothetical protein [unclassified Rhizobium]MBN8953545.1 hypothetical protein [Rhizobium tropici]OJY73253.1 MAG: hypothetical protein BGP09_19815 [Rhizobium sp. 60-20]RKD72222.1 hypothetical protein BJ928_1024 [Rhizobium sp. WW_1]